MTSKWLYIPVYSDGRTYSSDTAYDDFAEALSEIYGESDFDQPRCWSAFRFLIIRCQTEAGVTYEEMDRDTLEQHGIEMRRERDDANPPLFPAFNL